MTNLPYVSTDIIRQYQSEISQTASASTVKRKTASLRKFFDWAEKEGHLPSNPLASAQPEVISVTPQKGQGLKKAGKIVLALGIPISLVVLVFLLLKQLQIPIPFLPAPASEGIPEATLNLPGASPVPLPSPTPTAVSLEETDPLFSEVYQDGVLTLSGEAPTIKGIGGLLIESEAVTIKILDGSDGNIEINPDGGGIAHFLFEGTGENFLNAQAPNLTSGSLYYGIVANNATGYDLIRLQSGSNPVTRFSVDALGDTEVGGDLNVSGDISTSETVRLTSAGALTNITGYSQVSGNFSITQVAGEAATITKKAKGLSDVLTLTLDERGKGNSEYSTLTLKRYDGSANAMALFVDEGNARFDGQLQLGRFSSNPSAIGQGSLIFNTGDTTLYIWNGSSWVALGGGSTSGFWTRDGANGFLYPATITDNIGVGTSTPADELTISLATTSTQFNTGENGLGLRTTGTATSTSDHRHSPWIDLRASIFTGGAAAAKDIKIQNAGFSGISGAYGLKIESTDSSNILVARGDNGRVGIGIQNAINRLHVVGSNSSSGGIIRFGTGAGTSNKDYGFAIAGTDGDLFSIVQSSAAGLDPFTEIVSINGSGNVGIATTNPSSFKLQVAGSVGPDVDDTYDLGSNTLRWRDLYLGPASIHIGTSTADEYTISYDTTNNFLGFNVNGTGNAEVVFNSSGSVGIGTTSPNYLVDLTTSSSNTQLRFGSAASDTGGFLISTGVSQALLAGGASWNGTNWIAKATGAGILGSQSGETGVIHFFTNSSLVVGNSFTPTERARIEADGDFGIGTTAPNAKLDILTTSGDQVRFSYSTAQYATMNVTNDGFTTTGTLTTTATVSQDGALTLRATNGTDPTDIKMSSKATESRIILDPLPSAVTDSAFVDLFRNTSVNTGLASFRIFQADATATINTLINALGDSYFNGGDIGIGTTDPGRKLELSATTGSGAAIRMTEPDPRLEWRETDQGTDLKMWDQLVTGQVMLWRSLTDSGGLTANLMVLTRAGSVGIGITNPAQLLDVQGTIQGNFADSASTTTLCSSANATTNTNIVQCSGVDIAEWMPSDGNVEEGDLLTITNKPDWFPYIEKPDWTPLDPNEEFVVTKTTKANQTPLIGIYSTAGTRFGKEWNEYYVPVALAGRVPLKVTSENGPIRKGDPLASSSTAGAAMKADKEGVIIGTALENYDNPDPDQVAKIRVFINPSWYDPDVYLTDAGDLSIVNSQLSTDNNQQKYDLKNVSGQVIDQIGAFSEVVAANIEAGAIIASEATIEGALSAADFVAENVSAGFIETSDLATDSFYAFQGTIDNLLITGGLVSPVVETNLISPLAEETDITIKIGTRDDALSTSEPGKLSIENADGAEVASVDTSGNATFAKTVNSEGLIVNSASVAGELTAGKVIADEVVRTSGMSLTEIEELLKEVEADQALLAEITANADLGGSTITDLFVTGTAAMTNLSLTSSLALGSDFIVSSLVDQSTNLPINSINTLSAPLQLQSLAMAPIEFMAGKVKIDTSGNVEVAGNLNVAGKITAPSAEFKEALTEKLIIANPIDQPITQQIDQSIIETNATAGKGVVPAGIDTITIKNPSVTDYTLVYITPTSKTLNSVLYVKSKEAGLFSVGFTNPLDIDVNFNWWVIDLVDN